MAIPPKKRVQIFKSHEAMRDAMFADAARMSVQERWRELQRLNKQLLGHTWPQPGEPHRREVQWWRREPGESEAEFFQRVERDKFEWTYSRRKPLS